MQHNFNHEIHCATEAHRRGNAPSCRYHLLQAIESLDAPQHQYLRDLPLQTKVQGIDAQVWRVIKHEPEVLRVKMRLITSENHQEWDAPEDNRVEWRVTGCCGIWTIVDETCRGCDSPNCSHLWAQQKKCCPDCTCGTRISPHHNDGCLSAAPSPFTFADALAIMERGGECEHHWEVFGWVKSRIVKCERQYFHPMYRDWTHDFSDWSKLNWRHYNPEAQR